MKYLIISFFIPISAFIFACSSPMYKRIDNVKVGMDKTEVLDYLGSPTHSQFKNGQHEWVYHYFKDDKKYSRYIYLKNNKLIRISRQPNDLVVTPTKPLEKKEVKEIQKAFQQKKRLKKYEEGFKDLN